MDIGELRTFIAEPVAIQLAAIATGLVPQSVRGFGVQLDADGALRLGVVDAQAPELLRAPRASARLHGRRAAGRDRNLCQRRHAQHHLLVVSRTLSCLDERLGYRHSMLLVPADTKGQLVMLACHGYESGVGAQVRLGEGAIGVCAERRRALRLNNVARELGLISASLDPAVTMATPEIPLPGLAKVQSQLVAPALMQDELVAVLYVEDERQGRFSVDDSHALQLVASLLAPALFHESDDAEPVVPAETRPQPSVTPLPAVRDNLDTRIILLRRRLAERFPCVQIAPVGRRRFRLNIERPFELVEVTAGYP